MPFSVYIIEHIDSGRKYVGKAKNPHDRWSRHRRISKLTSGEHAFHIHRAMAKYGVAAFYFYEIAVFTEEPDAYDFEKQTVRSLRTTDPELGFNLVPGGVGTGSGADHPLYGKKRTIETCRKISEKNRGRKLTSEHIAKAVAGRAGYEHSEATKRKISASSMGKVISESQREKARANQLGKKPSHESEAKRVAKIIGRKNTPETIERMSESHSARWAGMTDEQRVAKCGGKRSDETRAKMSAGQKVHMAAMTSEERSAYIANRVTKRLASMAARTHEEIAASKAKFSATNALLSPEERSERSMRASATRRANRAAQLTPTATQGGPVE